MRGLVVAVLTTLLIVPSPAATAAEIVELAGDTVVSTERSGQLRVSVPQDAMVDAMSFATVTGEGRFFGVVLTRVGDETAFKASHMHHPADGDDRYTSRSIRLDAEDSDDPETLNPLGVPTGRACSVDCRLPAGEYDLLVVADGAPVRAALKIGGLDGAVALDGASLRPLRTSQAISDPRAIDWGSLIAGGGGLSFWGVSSHDGPSLVYSQMTSHVDATVAGKFEISFCVTVDGDCHTESSRHTYAANAVEGPEGLASYGSQDLPPGDHGLEASFTWDAVGGGEAHYDHAALFIHP